MYSQTILLSLLAATVQARFGQEQIPIGVIAAVNGGDPGEAPTIAGAAVSDLLAAANPCVKLKRGDQILAELGTGADAIAAAKGMVAAEQNFNPFAVTNPAICTDPGLPANPILRGILPLIDPAVPGADAINTLSAQTLNNPLNAAGKSIADLLTESGFTDFRGIADNGSGPQVAAGGNTGAGNNAGGNDQPAEQPAAEAPVVEAPVVETPATGGAEDFGLCNPGMDFVAGRPGRKADEFTFLPVDALTAQGQQEALNPNIITNRICDQLINVCQANQAAIDLCRSCQAQTLASGTRDQTTADDWNTCVGGSVAGGNNNPPAVEEPVEEPAAEEPVAEAPANNGNTGGNAQNFDGALGGAAPEIQDVGGNRPFVVNGNSFVNFGAACQRSCDVQKNQCANAANAGGQSFSVSDCETQQQACSAGCASTVARREARFIRVYRRRI